jgi:adenylate cyclase
MVETAPARRKLAAILAADIAGYSRLMGVDEEGTLARLKALRRDPIDPAVAECRGRIVTTAGDGMLVEFASAVEAVRCAMAVQAAMRERNAGVPADCRIEFRIGINLGDVILDEGDLYGDGVNIAARLEALAEPGGICLSGIVHDQVQGRLDCAFEDFGEPALKNIARPVRVYRVVPGPPASGLRAGGTPALPNSAPLPLPDKPSIAVLPFQNMSGDPEQEYFADGIAEDVITLLSKSHGLFVIARNSTFTYKGRAVDVKTVGRELGVRYVLEGSVRKAGGRVRVTAQLIEAATGGHLWAERYDRDLSDIFAVQDEITASVSSAILPNVERSERERASRKPPDSLDAWECYQRGLWHYARNDVREVERATGFFERAVALDPGFAEAHARLAGALSTRAVRFGNFADRQLLIPRAVESARRSIALDPGGALGRGVFSLLLMFLERHEEAITEADLAVSLDPNSASALGYQGGARAFGGRPREAVTPIEMAMRLSPFDPQTPQWLHFLGRANYLMGAYARAVETAGGLCRSYPAHRPAYLTLLAGLGQIGRREEAERIAAEAITRFGDEFRERLRHGPRPPESRPEDEERMIDGWRKAGLRD